MNIARYALRILTAPFRRLATAISDLRHPTAWLKEATGARRAAGMWVNTETALTLPVYYSILSLISKTVAMLPRCVYRRMDVGREKMYDHPVSWLIRNPNPRMTEMAFWELLVHWAVGWGAGAAWIERDGAGRPVALWPIHPAYLDRRMVDGELWYFWTTDLSKDGKQGIRVLRPEDVLDIHGLGSDGITGYSLIQVGAQAIGVGLAHQSYTAAFFERGIAGSGILSHPETLSEQARQRLGSSFDEAYGGADGKWKTVVLEEGVTYTRLGIPNDDAQLLETGNFNVVQVCRLAGVPPHMVGAMERATWANVEQMATEWAQYGVTPWCRRIEQECDRKLFGLRRGALYVHHVIDGLLRADFATRMEGYQKAVNSGWLSPDEIREREEMNPLPDGLGGNYFMQGANSTVDRIVNPPEPPPAPAPMPPPEPDEPDEEEDEEPEEPEEPEARVDHVRILNAVRPAFDLAADTIARREAKAVEARRAKGPLGPWLVKWHRDTPERIEGAFGPAVAMLRDVSAGLGGEDRPAVSAGPACRGAIEWWLATAAERAESSALVWSGELAERVWTAALMAQGGHHEADAA